MNPFKVSEAKFQEAAYVGGKSILSATTKGSGAALGPGAVEAMFGFEGGLLMKVGGWYLVPWANVKSTTLDGPPIELAGLEDLLGAAEAPKAEAPKRRAPDAGPETVGAPPGAAPVATAGATVECVGCGEKFPQGANHWCDPGVVKSRGLLG